VDGLLVRGDRRYLFVDTAGFRRRAVLEAEVDHVSVIQTGHSIRRADVAVIILDAGETSVRDMDVRVASEVEKAGRGIVIAVNKWDGPRAKARSRKAVAEEVRRCFRFALHAPVVFVSALAGTGLDSLLKATNEVWAACQTRVTTGRLNRLLATAVQALPPRTEGGAGPVKLLYGTQIGTAPPTFALMLSRSVNLHVSYCRYLENKIREEFGFRGAPIVLKVRARRH
jgi:GTP-binding protein